MNWITFAIMSAVATAFANIALKSSMNEMRPIPAALIRCLVPLPILGAWMLSSGFNVSDTGALTIAVLTSGTLNVFAFYAMFKAFRESEVSYIVPLISLAPPLMLGTDYLVNGTQPSVHAAIGVIVTAVGVYLLNLSSEQKSLLTPFKRVASDSGARWILATVLVWSLTASLDRKGVLASTPQTYSFLLFVIISLGFALLFVAQLATDKDVTLKHLAPSKAAVISIVVGALFLTTGDAFQFLGFDLAPASYIGAIRQSNSLLTVALAFFMFRETEIRQRAFGASVIMLGVVLITIS